MGTGFSSIFAGKSWTLNHLYFIRDGESRNEAAWLSSLLPSRQRAWERFFVGQRRDLYPRKRNYQIKKETSNQLGY
jgi:hypothetical protein